MVAKVPTRHGTPHKVLIPRRERERRRISIQHVCARLCFTLQVTTTDGEQHDDSLDLIDVPPELSPPPVTDGPAHHQQQQQSYYHVNGISVTQTTVVVVNATSTSPSQQQQTKPYENGLPAMQVGGRVSVMCERDFGEIVGQLSWKCLNSEKKIIGGSVNRAYLR